MKKIKIRKKETKEVKGGRKNMKAYLVEIETGTESGFILRAVVFSETSAGAINKFLTKHTQDLQEDDISINTECIEIIQ